jgi:hypothetical protein
MSVEYREIPRPADIVRGPNPTMRSFLTFAQRITTNKSKSPWVLTATIVVVLSLTFCSHVYGADSEKREFRYEPSTCKTDAQGKLYIALGTNVLAVPTSGAVVVARYGDNWLQPPDPAEPIGCPRNPEQLSGYAFPYAYNASVGKESGSFPNSHLQADLLQLINIPGSSGAPSPNDTEWGAELSGQKFAMQICSGDAISGHASEGWAIIHEELASGLAACRLKHGDLEKRTEDMRAAYIAHSNIYQTPLGRPFVVNCSDQLYTISVGHCDVDYVFGPGLAVNYQFQPHRGQRVIHIDQVFDFDRGLRAAISAALVKNYRWPDQASNRDDSSVGEKSQ